MRRKGLKSNSSSAEGSGSGAVINRRCEGRRGYTAPSAAAAADLTSEPPPPPLPRDFRALNASAGPSTLVQPFAQGHHRKKWGLNDLLSGQYFLY